MHGVIDGQSMSGKTWLAEYMGRTVSKDVNVAVYSPHYFGGEDFKKQFGATYATNNFSDFLKFVYTNPSCICFLDEFADKGTDATARKLMTQGRHFGHQVFLISQRFNRLDKTMRDQADIIFCFQVDIDDSKELGKAFIDENLTEAYKLSKFNCRLSIKSEPESQKGIFTKSKEDLKIVDSVCRRLVKDAPEPNMELMRAVGVYEGNINWDYLKEKGFIY